MKHPNWIQRELKLNKSAELMQRAGPGPK